MAKILNSKEQLDSWRTRYGSEFVSSLLELAKSFSRGHNVQAIELTLEEVKRTLYDYSINIETEKASGNKKTISLMRISIKVAKRKNFSATFSKGDTAQKGTASSAKTKGGQKKKAN